MDIKITPSHLSGTATAVASKSDAHRLLICAALADRATVLKIPERSADIDATAKCLAELGADISYSDGSFKVIPFAHKVSAPALNCGESGSTLRFLLPVAAALSDSAEFTGSGKLPQRPIGELLNAMSANGVSFSSDHLPLDTSGKLHRGDFSLPGNISSQYITGLLLALPLIGGGTIKLTSTLESTAYVDMSVSTMERFGVKVEKASDSYFVAPSSRYTSPESISADGDWSNAAFFLAAGALGANISMTGLDLGSVQGDKRILDILRRFGAQVCASDSISISGVDLNGAEIDISNIPDLLPILAVTACFCEGETHFTDGARLRIKESDRLKSTASLITSLGGDVTELSDGLIVRKCPLTGGVADGFNDHRIVMSAAIAAAFCKEPVIIKGAEAVNKSYPTFFEEYRKLGGTADVI